MPKSTKGGVDEFLAAPDSVRHSEVESRKLQERKARAEAEEARLLASKLTTLPSAEDLLADIIRVAEDENTNRNHYQFKSISRRRYQLYGRYPVSYVDERFGDFAHAKEQAGLKDQPGTRAKKAARANQSRLEHQMRYSSRYMLPYVVDLPEIERELTDHELILSISDTHSTFLDPFTWEVFLCACRDLVPDTIIANGDILEGSEISRFPKIPGWTIPLQLEFDFAREMFRQLRVVAPNARIIWVSGNHGLDRWARYLSQVAPEIANLRTMRFDKLAGLDDLNIELVQGGKFISPLGTEAQFPGLLFHGFYFVYHGKALGQTPAHSELRQVGHSGQSGHVHRASVAYGTTMAEMGKCWMSTPMGCNNLAGRSYMTGPTDGWQKGFGVAHLHPGGAVNQYPVITDGEYAVVEGYVYKRRFSSSELPDPSTNWIADLVVPTS